MKKIPGIKILGILLVVIFLIVPAAGCSGGQQGTADKSNRQNNNTQQGQEDQQVKKMAGDENKASAEITQTALQVWKDSIDNIWAHGAIEITNTGNVPIEIGDISISFTGNDNSIVGTASMILPVPEIIQPGETAYAGDSTLIEGIDNPSEVIDIEANIDFNQTDEQPQLLDVQNLKIAASDYGGPKVTGRVVNTSQENADDIRIIVALFDESSKLLGVYTESPDVTLAPEKNMGFETSYPDIEVKGFIDKVKKMVGKAYNWGL